MNSSEARRACLPASNGIMNARAIARHYAALLPGGINDVELLPPARIEIARARFLAESSHGLGYSVGNFASFQNAFGHGGYGGSFGFADPASGWAVGWTRNRFSEINTGTKVVEAIQNAL